MMTIGTPSGNDSFTVDGVQVAAIREFVAELVERSSYTSLRVPPAEFGAWAAALDEKIFYTHCSKNGYRHAAVCAWSLTSINFGTASVLVSADLNEGKVVDWAQYPEHEGDRRYYFRAFVVNETAIQRNLKYSKEN